MTCGMQMAVALIATVNAIDISVAQYRSIKARLIAKELIPSAVTSGQSIGGYDGDDDGDGDGDGMQFICDLWLCVCVDIVIRFTIPIAIAITIAFAC